MGEGCGYRTQIGHAPRVAVGAQGPPGPSRQGTDCPYMLTSLFSEIQWFGYRTRVKSLNRTSMIAVDYIPYLVSTSYCTVVLAVLRGPCLAVRCLQAASDGQRATLKDERVYVPLEETWG